MELIEWCKFRQKNGRDIALLGAFLAAIFVMIKVSNPSNNLALLFACGAFIAYTIGVSEIVLAKNQYRARVKY